MTDELIAQKCANALIKDVTLNPTLNWLANYQTLGLLAVTIGLIRRMYGGLWVGGNILLYPDRLVFQPNLINRKAAASDGTIEIPLTSVSVVETKFGILSGIVEVRHGHDSFKFRCFGSKAFARTVSDALPQ